MRRIATAFSTDAHQLHGTFMAKLAACIFEVDAEDFNSLIRAKKGELSQKGLHLSDDDIVKHFTKDEMKLHCRRRTRGTLTTINLIERLLHSLEGAKGTDTLGVPLFKSDTMWDVWSKQRKHVCCIQDPVDVTLYTKTGTLLKGGVQLNTYRCARGSTSLESFHLHLQSFVPGM